MNGLERLCGNAQLKHRLLSARGLSHAYILAGPPGCGKKTLAGLLAQALVCSGPEGQRPCGRCSDCRKAEGGIHPDILSPGGEKALTVAQVRALRADAYIRPNEAGRKVYLLHQAQDLNESAQNALLKLLEEGPAYACFLFLTDNAGAILPTVRSRCELLSLSPVSPAEAESWLLSRYPQLPPEQVREAARRCEGVLGRAEAWLEGGGEEEEGGIGRALLQQLQQGVLGALVHGVGVLEQVDLPGRLVGADIGVGAEGADGGHAEVLVPLPRPDDVGMDAGEGLPAVGAGPAGDLPGAGAHQRPGEKPGQGMLAAAGGAGEDVGVGEPPADGQAALDGLVSRQDLQTPHQARSKRSMSTTKMVAPPTVTSTGMEG